MFDGFLSIHLSGEMLKIHYQKVSVMHGVEHTVSLIFNAFSKSQFWIRLLQLIKKYTPYLVLAYITKLIIYSNQKYEFHNTNIGLFSGNDTRMNGYFVAMHRYLRMRKSLIATVSSAEFNNMSLNSKLTKVVS